MRPFSTSIFWLDLDWNLLGPHRRSLDNCLLNAIRLPTWMIYQVQLNRREASNRQFKHYTPVRKINILANVPTSFSLVPPQTAELALEPSDKALMFLMLSCVSYNTFCTILCGSRLAKKNLLTLTKFGAKTKTEFLIGRTEVRTIFLLLHYALGKWMYGQ